jgi:hypothetical protein
MVGAIDWRLSLFQRAATQPEMIETNYASHIKNSINAAVINVRRKRKPKKPKLDETDSPRYASAG